MTQQSPSRPDRPRYAVWAPHAARVRCRVGEAGTELGTNGTELELTRGADGWWAPQSLPSELDRAGIDYGYLIDDSDDLLPDPRSRFQPYGVHGPSRTFDAAEHDWADSAWTGRQLAGASIYELHIGTFNAASTDGGTGGTLDSAIERLDHLVDLGIDLVEVMPVNAFNGEHGWGYDGVAWFAVHHAYGGPAAYQRFVDACHTRGLGVIQDVVHNHLGPSGNYLPRFGPYLNEGVANPWGAALNLDAEDSDEVRSYLLDNLTMFLADYHVDGLRLDAVHALPDTRAVHILEEFAAHTDRLSAHVGRPLSLIAESDLNDPRLITSREANGYGLTGQWSDDFHHAVVANLTGDASGYYADFADLTALAKVCESGFLHDGSESSFRGRHHGRRLDTLKTPAWRLVVCSDNHDQIGNRADGSRLSARVDTGQQAIAAALTLLGPNTPMLFQGEEWGASTPWAFFTSHPEAELGEAVSKGRRSEFAKMEWGEVEVPDPQAESTFTGSFLDWEEPASDEHAPLLAFHRDLLALRRTEPDLTDPSFAATECTHARGGAGHRWFVLRRGSIAVVVNFADEAVDLQAPDSEPLLHFGDVTSTADQHRIRLGGHSVAVLRILGDRSIDQEFLAVQGDCRTPTESGESR